MAVQQHGTWEVPSSHDIPIHRKAEPNPVLRCEKFSTMPRKHGPLIHAHYYTYIRSDTGLKFNGKGGHTDIGFPLREIAENGVLSSDEKTRMNSSEGQDHGHIGDLMHGV